MLRGKLAVSLRECKDNNLTSWGHRKGAMNRAQVIGKNPFINIGNELTY